MNDISSSCDTHTEGGDVIGIGVGGSGNIIGKDISIVINEALSFGLNLLSNNYFKEYKSTEQDLEDWSNSIIFSRLMMIYYKILKDWSPNILPSMIVLDSRT